MNEKTPQDNIYASPLSEIVDFVFDENVLEHICRKAGFNEIRHCKVSESVEKELKGIERHGDAITTEYNELQTMVIEAVK